MGTVCQAGTSVLKSEYSDGCAEEAVKISASRNHNREGTSKGDEEDEEEVITVIEEEDEPKPVVRSLPASLVCPVVLSSIVLLSLAAAVIIFLIMPSGASRPSAGALHGDSEGDDAAERPTTKSGQSTSAATIHADASVPGKRKTAAPHVEYTVKTTHRVRADATKTRARANVTRTIKSIRQDHKGTATIRATGEDHEATVTLRATDVTGETAVKPTTMRATTTIKTPRKEKRFTRKRTTTKKTTTTRTRTTTTTAMPYNSLICCFLANMTLRAVSELPEDGLCDFSFYQAVEEKHAMLKGPGGPYAATWNLVLKAASQHTKTEYGLSFDYDFSDNTHKLLTERATRKVLSEFWSAKIYHYAFLTLRFFYLDVPRFRRVFNVLQKVKEILHGSSVPSHPSYFLVAETFSDTGHIQAAFNNIRERMRVSGAVVYGHLTFDERGKGVVMPPSFWNSTNINQTNYPFNLDSAHAALKEMSTWNLGYTQFFLSASLAGRFYKPFRKVGMLEKNGVVTGDPLFVGIGQVCNDSGYTWGFRNTTPIGAYYESVKAGTIITYDDVTSLREKLCRGKKLIPWLKYGLAAYHVDLDDPANKCGHGTYTRLRFLKKLLHFFNEKFLEASDYNECILL